MFYIADLHLHSHYSRATSKDLNLESLYQWARIKGIHVVGTGDFTHPLWFRELKEKLEPDGSGLFRLRHPPKTDVPGFRCSDIDVRFCLTSEISSIYKHGDKVRKNHNCVYAPDFETVARINAKLSQIGNLEADGRPILGLPARHLLEIVLEASEHAHLIPAHIWTPWFSMLGSKSGYDSVKACFRDLSDHIFALETGLSSDPEMNWRLSMLDRYTLVSNSDAHSPQKLGREANLFNTERSYFSLFEALKTKKGFLGTYEFFPEEGKYHMDGHRKCEVCLEPEESARYNNLCPRCGQPLTIGVLNRVSTLSDRTVPQRPEGAADFHYIVPLPEILAEIKGTGTSSKTVMQAFQQVVSSFGNEFTLLKEVPVTDIEKKSGAVMAEAIRRMRNHEVHPQGGYDGEYGVIKIFRDKELEAFKGQFDFFGTAPGGKPSRRATKENRPGKKGNPLPEGEEKSTFQALNAEQSAACAAEGAVLVTAGPGTGKTKTLIGWVVHCIQQRNAQAREVLAVTFTNKAADEMQERLTALLGKQAEQITVATFHSLCFGILKERYEQLQTVYDEECRAIMLRNLYPEKEENTIKKLSAELGNCFESGTTPTGEIAHIAATYRNEALRNGGIDLSDLVGAVVRLWENEREWLDIFRNRWNYIAADELQDINAMQYHFLLLLGRNKQLFAIGDPDQSIYGFRGSDVKLFFRFSRDFLAKEISLQHNYRSSGSIVEAAGAVIGQNILRKAASLKAIKPAGPSIQHFTVADEREEAACIASEIEKLVGGIDNLSSGHTYADGRYCFSDIAVLFRTRAVGRSLLLHLKQSGIPVRFGDASPLLCSAPFNAIADIIRLYLNPKDIVALDRVLATCMGMNREEKKRFLSNYTYNNRFILGEDGEDDFLKDGISGVVRRIFDKFIPDEKLNDAAMLKKEALLQLAGESRPGTKKHSTKLALTQFLHKLTLDTYTDVARLKSDAVHLLTFHASKGLEFPLVFIAGAEEGITPVLKKDTELEEERRLFYVALTRARDELFISNVLQRTSFGETQERTLSRFIREIPANLIRSFQPQKQKMKLDQLSLF